MDRVCTEAEWYERETAKAARTRKKRQRAERERERDNRPPGSALMKRVIDSCE